MTQMIEGSAPSLAQHRRSLAWLGSFKARVALLILGLVAFLAVFAPWIAPYDPSAIDYLAIAKPPSGQYWLGTDEAGRDILSRIIFGARISVLIVVLSIASSMVVGTLLGLVAGYVGGWTDEIIMRIVDSILSFPTLVLALLIIALLGPGLTNAIIAIAIVYTPNFARLVRGEVLGLRSREFVLAARAAGARWPHLLFREILPNVFGNVIVYASLAGSVALITESALSFLGLGVQPPAPSWGYMIAAGMQHWTYWWISLFPGLMIFVTVLAFNFLGDALRDALDPALDGT